MEAEQAKLNSNTLTTYKEFALNGFDQTNSEQKIIPVGSIIYDQNKKIVTMAEGDNGRLIAHFADLPENFNKDAVIEGKGRIQLLKDLNEIIVAQVPLKYVDIHATSSIRSNYPTVTIKMEYNLPSRDSQKDKVETLYLDEIDFLQVFTREKGGLIAFDGAGLPEETAILIEKKVAEIRRGLVFFFHPEEINWGIDSINGLNTFIDNVTENLTDKAPLPTQEEVIADLDESTKSGSLKINSPIRLSMLKATLIAHARMYDRSVEGSKEAEKYYQIARTVEPQFREIKQSLFQWLFSGKAPKLEPIDSTKKANELIDGLVVGESNTSTKSLNQKETFEVVQNKLKEKLDQQKIAILKELQTEKAKSIRKMINPYFNAKGSPMETYMKRLVIMIKEASTEEEFSDLENLLAELKNSDYYTYNGYWRLRWNLPNEDTLNTDKNFGWSYNSLLINEMISECIKRKDKILFSKRT